MIDLTRCATPPWKHQIRELEEHSEDKSRALFWQMRTGKSKTIIDTACHLYDADKIDAVMVFAPNGVHDNWVKRQIPEHAWPDIPMIGQTWKASLAGDRAKALDKKEWLARFAALLKDPDSLPVFSFNNESLIREDVRKLIARIVRAKRVLAVWDESTDFRTPGSKRTKMMRALARHVAYARILDGTPIENKPLHAFAQFELLDKSALGFARFEDFRLFFADWKPAHKGRGLVVSEYKNMDILRERLAKYASVVLREDCDDLPDLVSTVRRIELTAQQLATYEELRHNSTLETLNGVSIGEQAARIMKLQQVVSGFLIDEYGRNHVLPGENPRLIALADEVELTPGKIIIWAQFKKDFDLIAKTLRPIGVNFVQYHGDIPEQKRATALELFRDDERYKVFLGQPQAGGRGLELLADKIIWYSHTWSAITRKQACERATKMGGKNVELVDFIAPGVDEYIRSRVERNVEIASDVAGRGLKAVLAELAAG